MINYKKTSADWVIWSWDYFWCAPNRRAENWIIQITHAININTNDDLQVQEKFQLHQNVHFIVEQQKAMMMRASEEMKSASTRLECESDFLVWISFRLIDFLKVSRLVPLTILFGVILMTFLEC